MILSGHQPVYLPSIHLFNKIYLSDKFMFVGHCQFVGRSWHQRNRIRMTNGEELMLTVPVHGTQGTSIDDMEIVQDNWRRKHLASIRHAYGKRPFFDQYFPTIEEIITRPFNRLGFLNRALISQMCVWFRITTPMYDSYKFKKQTNILVPKGDDKYTPKLVPFIDGHKNEMLVQMCQAIGADTYLSNEGSRVYVVESILAAQDIAHRWQVCGHPVYDQGHPSFLPNMSALDILFNVGGTEAGRMIKVCGGFAP